MKALLVLGLAVIATGCGARLGSTSPAVPPSPQPVAEPAPQPAPQAAAKAVPESATTSPAIRFIATADSVAGVTAKGTLTHQGIVAADPAVLPLGSVIRVTLAGAYSGTYVVTDTGEKVVGHHIDIFMPSRLAARQFGKKSVLVTVIHTGDNRRDHRETSAPAALLLTGP